MTLIQLRYLVTTVDANLNISLAANRLNATQPGISKQIRQLEDELGFQIFIRKGKSLERISTSGLLVIERARAILADAENIRTVAANHRDDARGQMRVAATLTQSGFALGAALARLTARYPNVSTRVLPATRVEALSMLDRDEADIAMISTDGERPDGDVALPICHWHRMLIAPRSHPLAALNRPIEISDLAATPLVTYESALNPNSPVSRAFGALGFSPNLACTTRDTDTIKTCVRSGLGVGLLAEMALGASDVDFARIPVDGLFPSCTSWVVLRRDRVQRNYLVELLGVLAPHLSREQIFAALNGGGDAHLRALAPAWRSLSQSLTSQGGEGRRLKARLVVLKPEESAAANAA